MVHLRQCLEEAETYQATQPGGGGSKTKIEVGTKMLIGKLMKQNCIPVTPAYIELKKKNTKMRRKVKRERSKLELMDPGIYICICECKASTQWRGMGVA